MRLRLPVLAAVLVVAGCRDAEPTAEEERAEVVDQLAADLVAHTDGVLADEAAACVADGLVGAVGVDRLDEVVAAAAGDGDGALRDQVIDVFAACDALEAVRTAP